MQNNSQGRRDHFDSKAALVHDETNSRGLRADAHLVDETIPAEVKETVFGVITDCLKLNVRKESKVDADVLTIIPALSEVQVDTEASTDEFYKVCTETGVEGFCMKKYVALKK